MTDAGGWWCRDAGEPSGRPGPRPLTRSAPPRDCAPKGGRGRPRRAGRPLFTGDDTTPKGSRLPFSTLRGGTAPSVVVVMTDDTDALTCDEKLQAEIGQASKEHVEDFGWRPWPW